MTKATIEFDLTTQEGKNALELCLNAQKLRSALVEIREVLNKNHDSAMAVKNDIADELQFLTHLLDE